MNKKSAGDFAELPHEFDEKIHQQQQKRRIDIIVTAKRYIIAAQEKQKQYFDTKHANPHLFTVGQQMLLKDFCRKKRKGGKLAMRYIGPYKITSATKKGQHPVSRKTSKAIGSHLKVYVPRQNDVL